MRVARFVAVSTAVIAAGLVATAAAVVIDRGWAVLPLNAASAQNSPTAETGNSVASESAAMPVPAHRVAQALPLPAQAAPPSQQPVPATPSAAPQPTPVPSNAPQPITAKQSDAEVVFTLVRASMVGLDEANQTGNYTVLRDLSAPGFQQKNSAADLARIFAPIREAKVDLSQAVLLDPHLTQATLNQDKMLYVVGAFDTKPLPVKFELLFEAVAGRWRIFGISVTPIRKVEDAPVAQASGPPAKPPRARSERSAAPIAPAAGAASAGRPK